MANIIIRREIMKKYGFDKLVGRVPEGKSKFLVLPNGNYDYETTDENKKLWDSLDESTRDFCISCVKENKDLENILEEMKQKQ